MLKRIYNSQLLKISGIYTASSVINSTIPFFLMPVLTRYLSPTDYGITAMFSVLLGLTSPFVGLSIQGAISVKYFDKEGTDLPKYVGNCLFILAASSILVACVFAIFAGPISRISTFPLHWLWIAVPVSAGQFIILILMALWQVQNKALNYGAFQILQTLINIGLTLLLVVGFGKNWQGRIEGQVIAIFIFASLAFYSLIKNGWVKFIYDESYVKNALRFGVPLIPHTLGGMLIAQTDRIFITNMVGVAATGVYSVGFQVAAIIGLIATAFNSAYVPWLYERLRENSFVTKRRIVKLTYLYFAAILLFAVGLSLVAPWFLSFFVGKQFFGAYKYTMWIALGFAFHGMYYMVANYIFYAEKTRILAWVTFLTAILNIIFNYVLIKLNGAVGAAQASALAFFVSFILTWILSAKVHPMPWNLARAARAELDPRVELEVLRETA